MTTNIQNGLMIFNKKINLLIVDDDAVLRDALSGIFVSPLFNISTAATLNQACDLIDRAPDCWHCRIVDIDLGHGRTGLELLSRYPEFQFTIVLSGLKRMSLAAEAIRLGARMVFDKDPSSIERLYDEVCKIAALGFLLNGKRCEHIDVFEILRDDTITNIDDWAHQGCIELRKLHRICDLYPPITPNFGLALYRAIYFLLRNPTGSTNMQFTDEARLKYESWINYIVQRFSGLRNQPLP